MRIMSLVGPVVCLAMVAACTSPVERPGGDAAPAGSAPPPSSSVSPTTSPESASPTQSRPPANAALILGPDGLGALKLGMTRQQAQATGLVFPFENDPNSNACLWRTRLRSAPSGRGVVFHSERLGVATIAGYPGVKTPQGIGVGSSLADVRRAYPDWHDITGDGDNSGRGPAKVPGSSRARYRIVTNNGAVIELNLQYADQDCYE
jgi:hypothetical protein